jgi:hypothetical protein
MLLGACNERLPFEPITTNDFDWAPSIILKANDYQRIRIGIEGPPRKELLRNIVSYVYMIREERTGNIAFLDTLGNYIAPGYLFDGEKHIWSQDSWPSLQYNASYSTQVYVTYQTGAPKYSNSISFTTPPERGRVIRRIAILPDDFWDFSYIALHKRQIILYRPPQRLVAIDTSTGQTTLLNDRFYPPGNESDWQMFTCLAVVGDTLYAYYENRGTTEYTIVAFDLNTRSMKSYPKISLATKRLAKILSDGSSLYGLWFLNNVEQVTTIDPATGIISHVFPEVPWTVQSSDEMITDGKSLWVSRNESFNNRLIRYDLATLQPLDQSHNPVFYSNGLAWDGANFWVIDNETQSIVKLQLSGN